VPVRETLRQSIISAHSNSRSGEILLDIDKQIGTSSMHFFTSILYDLRTLLGDAPATFLEIGSFKGNSSALMLSHPFPTTVFSVDYCQLTFDGIPQERVIKQTHERFSKPGSTATLITGSSHDDSVIRQLIAANVSADILLIDADHSYESVRTDWTIYQRFLKPGGFVVFDDYCDRHYSPQVKRAVDDIVNSLPSTQFIPIGCIPNLQNLPLPPGIRYDDHTMGNDFVIKYLGPPSPPLHSRIAVTIPTYRRPDGSTPAHIASLFNMLSKQTYTDFTVYLIGDGYDDHAEFETLANAYTGSIVKHNSPYHLRSLPLSRTRMWACGGTLAIRTGFRKAVEDGADIILMLDDDDSWSPDHIQRIVNARQGSCALSTMANHCDGSILPRNIPRQDSVTRWLPSPGDQIRSASAYTADMYHLLSWFWDHYLQRVISNTPGLDAQDAECHSWLRRHISVRPSLHSSFLITSTTVHHLQEGYVLHS
jgi:predicted O-methyltransferase YrrM